MWRRDNVGGLGNTSRDLSRVSVSNESLFSFYFILRLAISPHRWTAFDDLRAVFLRKSLSAAEQRFPLKCVLVEAMTYFVVVEFIQLCGRKTK